MLRYTNRDVFLQYFNTGQAPWKSEGERQVQLLKYAYSFTAEIEQHLRTPYFVMKSIDKRRNPIGWSQALE